ncbi:MAG: hypothetical protein DMG65_06895 [Candidatus Angelobacter sp. Gp1-AA117]|nr:MAG: hypothetical protein DMG65_06895 [Candidatus Angelobacter sp. Gp1-AA117]
MQPSIPQAFHGGRFFETIGIGFHDLSRADSVISADVLDAWFDPAPRVVEKLREYLPFLMRTSPPVHGDGLASAISEVRGIPAANLCLGGGSSHLIFTLLPLLTSEKSRVLILDPMYGEYAHVLEQVLHRNVCRHHLYEEESFQIDSAPLFEHVRVLQPDLLIMVNPNSPTGQYWRRAELLELLQRFPDTLCLVDETYIDYLFGNQSLESQVTRFKNLVVLKSMSKVYALSGMRVAYMAAAEEIVRKVSRYLPPWSVSLPAQVAAVEALSNPEYYQQRYRDTHLLRCAALESFGEFEGLQAFGSCANFYLLKCLQQSAAWVQQQLEAENIFVRHCDSMSPRFHDNFLRIAVKGKEQNDRIVSALKRVSLPNLVPLETFGG